MAAAVARRFLLQSSLLTLDSKPSHNFSRLRSVLSFPHFSTTITAAASSHTNRRSCSKKKNVKQKETEAAAEAAVKRRTRSDKVFDEESVLRYGGSGSHIPVMLGEVLEAFAFSQLRSFVDCTVGAAGHSSAIIEAHPEMKLYIGLDVDPIAYEKAQAQINTIVNVDSCGSNSVLKAFTFLKNYKDIKYVLHEVDEKLLISGVDGILMDLGMSSMQVNNAERGFSVLCDGPLDMRMNPQGYDRQVLEQKTY